MCVCIMWSLFTKIMIFFFLIYPLLSYSLLNFYPHLQSKKKNSDVFNDLQMESLCGLWTDTLKKQAKKDME